MMEWKLKKFEELTGEEVYKILKLRTEVFIVEQECPYQDSDNKDIDAYHLYLEENGEIAAYSRILKRGVSFDEAAIGRVLVNKKYRGKGLAKEMMLKAIQVMEETFNEIEIKIQAQAYLIHFYESVGFKGVSDQYLEDDIPHIDMLYKKEL